MQDSKRIPTQVNEFLLVADEAAEDMYHRTPEGWLCISMRHTAGDLCWHETSRYVVSFAQAYAAWRESVESKEDTL